MKIIQGRILRQMRGVWLMTMEKNKWEGTEVGYRS
jgi:hypothetical protein